MILVVGATGLLGSEICRVLAVGGSPVRALLRATADAAKVSKLEQSGVKLIQGDLKQRASLDAGCKGATAVISTASCTFSPQADDSIRSVDLEGQLGLVEAARSAGVRHFVFVSFPEVAVSFPLQDAKRAVERALVASGMIYTILQPTFFMEVWLSPALGFDAPNARAQIFGTAGRPISWISFADVAMFAAASLTAPAARNAIVRLGGPEALTPQQVVQIFEQVSGRRFAVEQISEESLRAKWKAAEDPLEKSFAALMLYYAAGETIDMTEMRWGAARLKSIEDFALHG